MGIYRPKMWDEADYRRLLFTNSAVTVYDYPFFHGCIDNYLPDQGYQDLVKTFPKEILHINYTPKATLDSDNPRLKDLWSKNPFWKSLLDFFTARAFVEDLQKFIMPAVIRDRGYSDQRDWYCVNDWSKAPSSAAATPIKVTFKFS